MDHISQYTHHSVYINSVSDRYIELYEKVTGHKFEKAADSEDLAKRIENNVMNFLKK